MVVVTSGDWQSTGSKMGSSLTSGTFIIFRGEDIDGDGLTDLMVGIGGLTKTVPGKYVVARNLGEGRFQ